MLEPSSIVLLIAGLVGLGMISSSIRNTVMRSALIVLVLVVVGAFMGVAEAVGQPIPAYKATFTGTIGDKGITLFIERFGDHLTGSYFYGGNRTNSLALSGTVTDDTFDATETVAGQVTDR